MLQIHLEPKHYDTDALIVVGDADMAAAYCALLRGDGWRIRTITADLCGPDLLHARTVVLCGWTAVRAVTQCDCCSLPIYGTVTIACGEPIAEEIAAALDRGVDLIVEQPCSPPIFLKRIRSAMRWSALPSYGRRLIADPLPLLSERRER